MLRQTIKEDAPKEFVLELLLIESENIVNSRPLTHLPVDVQDHEPLTPNHFLIRYDNAAYTPAVKKFNQSVYGPKKQWRALKLIRDSLWKRWVLEYLYTLTIRVKWCERTIQIQEGDMVFVCDPNIPKHQ